MPSHDFSKLIRDLRAAAPGSRYKVDISYDWRLYNDEFDLDNAVVTLAKRNGVQVSSADDAANTRRLYTLEGAPERVADAIEPVNKILNDKAALPVRFWGLNRMVADLQWKLGSLCLEKGLDPFSPTIYPNTPRRGMTTLIGELKGPLADAMIVAIDTQRAWYRALGRPLPPLAPPKAPLIARESAGAGLAG